MTAVRDFQEILVKLESDKIKERGEGVARCRAFLTSNRNLNAVNADPRFTWIQALQTMFSVVIKERNTLVQKKTAATEKRLEEATQMVKLAAVKLYKNVNRKTAKAIIAHLTQLTAVAGKLQPFALTYMKALRAVLSYTPHLEHLDERAWTDIVMLCFSAVLGDKIRIGQDFVDDTVLDIDEDGVGPAGALRTTAAEEIVMPTKTRRTATATEIELLGVVEVVFRSRSSPFLTYAQAIFRKFLRFFRLFPSETSAHLSAVTALNRAFAEVDLNDQHSMKQIGRHLWPHLLALWATKNASLKEQVVMSLRYLFPFVVPVHAHAKHESERDVLSRAKELYEAVMTEPTIRWREAYDVDIDHLGLGIRSDESTTAPYHATTFRIGADFDEKDAIAWSVVELGADALARIYEVDDVAVGTSEQADVDVLSPVQRGKRRKLEDPLSNLLDSLTDPNTPTNIIVFRLQILVFLVDRHWQSLTAEARVRVGDALVPLLSLSDAQIQRWSCLLAAALVHTRFDDAARTDASQTPSRRNRSPSTSRWDQVWHLALRKLSVSEVARSAAHLANVLLAHDRIGTAVLSDSVESFVKDLDVQTAHFPSDTVCLFFEWCMAIATSDARLAYLKVHDKMLAWLTTGWAALDGIHRLHAFGQQRPHADPLSEPGLTSLIARLTGVSTASSTAHPYLVPDCPVATMAIELSETSRIRDYINAKVPPYIRDKRDRATDTQKLRKPADYDAIGGAPEDLGHTRPRKVSAWLFKTLASLRQAATGNEQYWSSMTVEQARRHLDIACLALQIEGIFTASDIPPNRRLSREAVDLVIDLAPVLTLKRWTPSDRARILEALSPILPERARNLQAVEYPVLLDPGAASDIPSRLLPKKAASGSELTATRATILLAIWKNEEARRMLDELATVARYLISQKGETSQASSDSGPDGTQASQRIKDLEQTQRADDFEEIRVGTSRSADVGEGNGHGASRSAAFVIGTCVDIFAAVEMAGAASTTPVRLREVMEAVVATDSGEEAIAIAEEAFAAARSGLAQFGLAQAETVLDHIGGELLPDYRYARNERFALVVLQFLDCTTHLWVASDTSHDDFALRARVVIAWVIDMLRKKTLASWRVRLQFTAFLDHYLSHDPSQRHWDLNGSAPRSEEGRMITPTTIIPFMLSDSDFRVRFLATSSVARLFELCAQLGLAEATLFDDIRANGATNVVETERMLTQILCNANMIIAAGSRRRAPYQLLVRISGQSPELAEVAVATLQGVAERLGFKSLAQLYLHYARYFTWADIRTSQEESTADLAQRLPYRACGFDTLRDARLADFRRTASWILQYNEHNDAFLTMCEVIGRTPQEVRLECFAETCALAIVLQPTDGARLADRLSEFAYGAGAADAYQQEQLFDSALDEIVTEIFSLLWWGEWPAGSPSFLQHDPKAGAAFSDLLQLSEPYILRAEPPPPHFPPEQVVSAVEWLDAQRKVLSTNAVLFAVVHRLLNAASDAVFVSERCRRLLALAVAIALAHRTMRDETIQAFLIDGLTSVLAQGGAVSLAAPMLQSSIAISLQLVTQRSKPGSAAPRRLCEQLIRAAEACESLRDIAHDEHEAVAAQRLYAALEGGVQKLTLFGEATVAEAALLWPRRTFTLASISIDQICQALASSFVPIDKFPIASQLLAHPQYQDLLRRPDRQRIAWHLMQAVRPDRSPRPEDSLAFARIVYDLAGEYQAPSVGDAECARTEAQGVANPDNLDGVRKLVVNLVLVQLRDEDRQVADIAFRAARLVLGIDGTAALFAGAAVDDASEDLVTKLASPALQRPDRRRRPNARSLTELESHEWVRMSADTDKWSQRFSELLADVLAVKDPLFGQIVPLIQASAAFARATLPALSHAVLLSGALGDDGEPTAALTSYFQRLLGFADAAVASVGLVVDIIVNLRKHARPEIRASQPSRFDTWLSIPWVNVAQGAIKTGRHLTALLCLDLAHEYDRLFAMTNQGQPYSRAQDDKAQQLLYAIYESIDEPDGFYGRQSSNVREALLRRYHHEGNWDGAFKTWGARHEAQVYHPDRRDSAATGGVVAAMASFGFNRLALDVWQPARLSGGLVDKDVASELPYELGWRTDVWDLPVDRTTATSSSATLYSALRACRTSRSIDAARTISIDALTSEVQKLGRVSLDYPTPDPGAMSTLLALRETVEFGTIATGSSIDPSFAKVPEQTSFRDAEKILATRNSLLRGIRAREKVEQVGDEFVSELYKVATEAQKACLIELSRLGRRRGHLQESLNAITVAREVVETEQDPEIDEELAQVLWAQGEHKTAITLLTKVHEASPQRSAVIFSRLGEWTADARLHSSKEILERYFEPASRALDREIDAQERGQVHIAFARFADGQYEDLRDVAKERNVRFTAYEKRKTLELKEMERRLQDGSLESGDIKRTRKQAEEHLADDRRQLVEAQQLAKDMLSRALHNYALALTASGAHDDHVFRFCALWLSCADDDELHTNLKKALADVPSHKFVFLAYQLSARLTKSAKPTPAASNIQSLVYRLCTQHPFHTLYPVQSLRSTDAGSAPVSRSSRRSSTSRESSVGLGANNSRSQAANDLIEKAKRSDRLRKRIEAVELACSAYAEWASFNIKNHNPYVVDPSSDSRQLKKGPLAIVPKLKIKSAMQNLPIPVTTFHLAVDPAGRYDDSTFPTIVKYDDYFETAGGIHLPKIVVCRGSDGIGYKQLLKGDDDIRQDAVMEQAFDLVNTLLAKDEGGRRRKLRIRTYKVVPLQNRNGLLEFVRDTVPLGSILGSLYDKLAPNTPRKARDSLRQIEQRYKSSYDRQVLHKDETFRKILKETPPLFRHHFWLKHKVPALWFDMRLNYSRSVATTSIIGHVVGLGDRHVSNILMDEARGELVHIDLGIAFDQGKRLPIPELVPFRLTQNLVDGFGMTGVDGVFRRCCEETLRVMRERSSVIMTILEVFKHDPLQSWAVSAEMAKRIQGSSDADAEALEELPDDADRALGIIRAKLDDRLSVEYTVNKLIQEATEVTHLARIFSGWQPYF
ncbi:hypothetical protein JCM10908_001886 [Rhodotorula pacifica]|uniref:DNA-binding protein kinase TEL1 n=1 Tax=Rhodotorula pacifica TaxID=1495444 RepID=UPI003179A8AA